MSSDTLARIDQHIAGLEEQIQAARHLRAILVSNPGLADVLLPNIPQATGRPRGTKAEGDDDDKPRTTKGRGGPTAREHYSQVVGYLQSKGNAWSTTLTIEQGAELTRNQVINILYKAYSGFFEGRKSPENAREKEWRLKIPENGTGGEG